MRASRLSRQANRPICKESRVVLRSPENATRVILAKKQVAILPEKKDYRTL